MDAMQSLANLSLDRIVNICVRYEEGTRKTGEEDLLLRNLLDSESTDSTAEEPQPLLKKLNTSNPEEEIGNLASNDRENYLEQNLEAGKWLMDTWRYIRASPVLKEEGYSKLNFALQTTNLRFQIMTLNPILEVKCFESNNELFVEMENQDYFKDILSSKEDMRTHLEKDVKELRITKVSKFSNKLLINRLTPIDQLLLHLKSLKIFCCRSYEIKSVNLMQSLSSSSDLTVFDARCSLEIFFKYILGIKIEKNECGKSILESSWDNLFEDTSNSQYIDSVVQQSRPTWPELKYLLEFMKETVCNMTMVYSLAFAVLQKLTIVGNFDYWRNLCNPIQLFYFGIDEPYTNTKCYTCFGKYFAQRFQFVNSRHLHFLYCTDQLAKSFKAFNCIYIDKETLDVLKKIHMSSDYQIKVTSASSITEEILSDYPFLLEVVENYQFMGPKHIDHFLSKCNTLNTVYVYHDHNIVAEERQFLVAIKYFSIIINSIYTVFCNGIDYFLLSFPNIENLILTFIKMVKFVDYTTFVKIENLSKMNRLKSITVLFYNSDWKELSQIYIEFLCLLSAAASPQTKLFLLYDKHLEVDTFHELRNKRWNIKYPDLIAEQYFCYKMP